MKTLYGLPALLCTICGLAQAAPAGSVSSILVDDKFINGNSQLQDLPNNSLWLFNGRTNNVRTDQVGSVTFDVTPAGASSEAFWAYFTNAGSPVVLGVGDKLSASMVFSLSGFLANGQDIRFGVLDSQGTRNTTNLAGGQNDATFIGDTGYGLDFYPSGTGSPFVFGRRAVLSNANVFNNFADFTTIQGGESPDRQKLTDDTIYTLTYAIERLTDTTTRLSTSVTGGTLSGLNYSAVESTATPATSFDYFAFRIGGTNFTRQITFTELLVQYTPAAPVIVSQPQPSSLTVQVGSNVTMAVGASGNALIYQWQKDGKAIPANDSASTAILKLTNVQLSDAGSYNLQASNAGGTVTSNPVTLKVSSSPVPPAPAVLTQPKDTTITLGDSTSLSVAASGNGLVYQWFKNGILIPNATLARLTFQNAQVSDSASYYVVVSNSSGSIASAPATLLMISTLTAVSVSPYPARNDLCTDTPLLMQFDQAPRVGKTGKIRVYNSQGAIVDTIDMAANPQTLLVGGSPFSYFPIMVSGNTARIQLHQQLPYGDSYSITVDPGVLTDAGGAPYGGLTDITLWHFATRSNGPSAGTTALTVDADGAGDFCTVQGAIDFVPPNNTQPTTIAVRPRTYTGIVYVPSGKPFITVRGDDRENTVIQYPNNNSLNPSTVGRALFGDDAADFTLENITLRNTTPHGGSQAESFRSNANRVLLNRVSLYSFQDTLLMQGAGFVTDSFIEGDVDFMWGTGPVFIQNSELKAATSGGYYTQIRNPTGQAGFVFLNDRLTSEPGVTGMYLSRIDPNVFPYSQVVYINSAMDAQVIPEAWLLNNASAAPNVQFWEYKSTDLTGAPLDVSQRAPFSRQLTSQEAAQWSDPAFVLGGWVPYTVNSTATRIKLIPILDPLSGQVSGPLVQLLTVDWSAAAGHSSTDAIRLYQVGDLDGSPISSQAIGTANTGRLTFTLLPIPGQYEFRMFRNGEATPVATSGIVTVQ